jgi:hypothetical protein
MFTPEQRAAAAAAAAAPTATAPTTHTADVQMRERAAQPAPVIRQSMIENFDEANPDDDDALVSVRTMDSATSAMDSVVWVNHPKHVHLPSTRLNYAV